MVVSVDNIRGCEIRLHLPAMGAPAETQAKQQSRTPLMYLLHLDSSPATRHCELVEQLYPVGSDNVTVGALPSWTLQKYDIGCFPTQPGHPNFSTLHLFCNVLCSEAPSRVLHPSRSILDFGFHHSNLTGQERVESHSMSNALQ